MNQAVGGLVILCVAVRESVKWVRTKPWAIKSLPQNAINGKTKP